MKTLSYVIEAFDKKSPEHVTEVLRVRNVPVDRNVLVSIGQSFGLSRGLHHRNRRDLDEAATTDAANRDDTSTNPLQDGDSPVKLQVLYNDQPVTLEPDTSSPGEVHVEAHPGGRPEGGAEGQVRDQQHLARHGWRGAGGQRQEHPVRG